MENLISCSTRLSLEPQTNTEDDYSPYILNDQNQILIDLITLDYVFVKTSPKQQIKGKQPFYLTDFIRSKNKLEDNKWFCHYPAHNSNGNDLLIFPTENSLGQCQYCIQSKQISTINPSIFGNEGYLSTNAFHLKYFEKFQTIVCLVFETSLLMVYNIDLKNPEKIQKSQFEFFHQEPSGQLKSCVFYEKDVFSILFWSSRVCFVDVFILSSNSSLQKNSGGKMTIHLNQGDQLVKCFIISSDMLGMIFNTKNGVVFTTMNLTNFYVISGSSIYNIDNKIFMNREYLRAPHDDAFVISFGNFVFYEDDFEDSDSQNGDSKRYKQYEIVDIDRGDIRLYNFGKIANDKLVLLSKNSVEIDGVKATANQVLLEIDNFEGVDHFAYIMKNLKGDGQEEGDAYFYQQTVCKRDCKTFYFWLLQTITSSFKFEKLNPSEILEIANLFKF